MKCDNCRARAEMNLIDTCCEAGTCNIFKDVHHHKLEDPYYKCPYCKHEVSVEEVEE